MSRTADDVEGDADGQFAREGLALARAAGQQDRSRRFAFQVQDVAQDLELLRLKGVRVEQRDQVPVDGRLIAGRSRPFGKGAAKRNRRGGRGSRGRRLCGLEGFPFGPERPGRRGFRHDL
jgi:hypothetical protein